MTWNKATAKNEIRKYFKKHGVCAASATSSSTDGKIYELYSLVELLAWLKARYGVQIQFNGTTVDFKASPGLIDRSRSYFSVVAGGRIAEVHTDIEVRTLGSTEPGAVIDRSAYHEIDIVLVPIGVLDGSNPNRGEVLLGIECKSSPNLKKKRCQTSPRCATGAFLSLSSP